MCDYTITLQTPEDEPDIDPLLDLTFGEARKARPSYRLRADVSPIEKLCFTVKSSNGELLATLRFWPVSLQGEEVILLGPLAVQPVLQGKGIGRALVAHGLTIAKDLGYRLCFVVGEAFYYAPYGFVLGHPLGFDMPAQVSSDKFQVLSLQDESYETMPNGTIQPLTGHLKKNVLQKKA